nr:hypothetical protein [Tanacetum cinerariifolium]
PDPARGGAQAGRRQPVRQRDFFAGVHRPGVQPARGRARPADQRVPQHQLFGGGPGPDRTHLRHLLPPEGLTADAPRLPVPPAHRGRPRRQWPDRAAPERQ